MTQYSKDTHVLKGHIEINDIPLPDNMEVKVFVVPKVNLSKFSFDKVRKLTKSIKENLSDDIEMERNER